EPEEHGEDHPEEEVECPHHLRGLSEAEPIDSLSGHHVAVRVGRFEGGECTTTPTLRRIRLGHLPTLRFGSTARKQFCEQAPGSDSFDSGGRGEYHAAFILRNTHTAARRDEALGGC